MVTNAIAPQSQQQVTGSEIVNLGAIIAQMNAQAQLQAQEQAGYYQPSTLGNMAGAQPTLARDQLNAQTGIQRDTLNASIADARRQYELDVQRYGLEVANFNYTQRLGESEARLKSLGLLSSLTGPQDYLKYNYVLNNMAAPQGTAADPFQISQGVNQQYTAPPIPNVPQPPPTTAPAATTPPFGGGTGGQTGGGGTQQAIPQQTQQQYIPPPSPSGIAISGNPQADAALAASSGWAGAPPDIMAEFNRISQGMNQTYNNAMQQNPNFQLFASGGYSPGGNNIAITGDSPSGRPTGNEEAVISQGPFTVLNHQQTQQAGMLGQPPMMGGGGMLPQIIQQAQEQWSQPQHEQPGGVGGGQQRQWNGMPQGMSRPQGGMGGGYNPITRNQRPQEGSDWPRQAQPDVQPSPVEAPPAVPTGPQVPQGGMQLPPQWMALLQQIMGGQIPHAATGGTFGTTSAPDNGFFNFNTYTPQDTQNAPFIQQTLGNQASPAFQQRGEALGPFGKQPFSYTNYLSMLPSAQQMLQGYVETPTGMGGLGGNFMDELARSRRAAATGVSFGPAQYGR